MKLVRLRFNETYSKVHIDEHLSDMLPLQSGLKQGDALLLFNFLCDFDMWCIRCYLPTCPIVLTTAMDVNKVEVEVEICH
jgi:hypothetical protein